MFNYVCTEKPVEFIINLNNFKGIVRCECVVGRKNLKTQATPLLCPTDLK